MAFALEWGDWTIAALGAAAAVAWIVRQINGAFLSAYGQKEGELEAINKNLDLLRRQIAEVTTTKETIKDQIGGDRWIQQRLWEERRAVYFDLVRAARASSDAWESAKRAEPPSSDLAREAVKRDFEVFNLGPAVMIFASPEVRRSFDTWVSKTAGDRTPKTRQEAAFGLMMETISSARSDFGVDRLETVTFLKAEIRANQ